MRYHLPAVLFAALLSSCATSPIPKGYTGPKAKITDTLNRRSNSQVEIFMVTHVNGRLIQNTEQATASANQGMGMGFAFTKVIDREIPAQPSILRLRGTTRYASDMQALFGKTYSAGGDVEFKPESGGAYVVKGELTAARQAVWVENAATGKVVTRIVTERR